MRVTLSGAEESPRAGGCGEAGRGHMKSCWSLPSFSSRNGAHHIHYIFLAKNSRMGPPDQKGTSFRVPGRKRTGERFSQLSSQSTQNQVPDCGVSPRPPAGQPAPPGGWRHVFPAVESSVKSGCPAQHRCWLNE